MLFAQNWYQTVLEHVYCLNELQFGIIPVLN